MFFENQIGQPYQLSRAKTPSWLEAEKKSKNFISSECFIMQLFPCFEDRLIIMLPSLPDGSGF
jgi:hypothetical protein